jgi:hypothetical protein
LYPCALSRGASHSQVLVHDKQNRPDFISILGSHILTCDDDSNDLPTVKARWKAQLKLLREVKKEAFDHRVLHLESLLENKADLADGDSTETDKETHAARKDKVKRVKRMINTEGMRKPYRIIKSAMKSAPSGGLSKLFVLVNPKDPKVAARFCDPDGSLSKLQLIAMTKSNKHSVKYETILESDVMKKELHMRTTVSGSGKHMILPLDMASSMTLLDSIV